MPVSYILEQEWCIYNSISKWR